MFKAWEPPLQSLAAVTFLNYAARGLTFPFISLFLVAVGFSGTEIGFILSASAALRLIFPPLVHTIADRTDAHRKLFYGLTVGNSVTTAALVAVTSNIGLGATVVLRDSLDMPSASLLSQLTITKLGQMGRNIYGRLRAWGSLGWAVTTLVSGAIFSVGGYALLFISAAVLNLLSLPFSRTLPEHTSESMQQDEQDERLPKATIRRKPGFYVLMASNMLFYIGFSAIAGFSNIYFQEELGASTALIGVLASVAALAEIPSMIFIDSLLKRLNIRMTLNIGMLGMAGIWFAFALLEGTSLLIPLMIIRGTFYTFHNVTMTLLVSRISHPSNVSTNQAIAQVTMPAIASLLTGSVAGWIFDNIGARTLFQVGALIGVLAVLILIAGRRTLKRTTETTPVTEPVPDALPDVVEEVS
jgi:MFS transporter, PPP family, 3-phenylpropionic acid transporter